MLIYTVRAGDTLFRIALRLGSTVQLIVAANNLENPDIIAPGQKLLIPVLSGTRVRVMPGDTVFLLARRYDLPVEVIAAANNLRPPYTIFPGQILEIPLTLPNTNGCIAFLSTRANGQPDIWLRNPSRINPSRVTTRLGLPGSIPKWSSDGSRIAFIGVRGALFIANIFTGLVTSLIEALPEFTPFDWAPDGRTIAISLREQVILVDTVTAATVFLTNGDFPTFLPDGNSLVFTRQVNAVWQVFQINIDGTGLRQITNLRESGVISGLDVDPRGELVTFTLPGASISIVHIVEIATGRQRETPQGQQGKDYFPRFSPNGEFLAYNSTIFSETAGFAGLIRVVDREGQLVSDLTDTACFGDRLAWSPDNSSIVYVNCLTQLSQLTVVGLHGLPVQITAHGNNSFPDWKSGDCPNL